ncbi:CopG family transcriptional regulator [Bacteroidota bacterium]
MSKTLTIRIDDSTYELFKLAADGERRTISNFIEFAAINYTLNDLFVSDEEMDEIKAILPGIKRGLAETKKGKYKIVE